MPAASTPDKRTDDKGSVCSVRMAFNFAVGAIALIAAGLIGYALYAWLVEG